MLWSIQRTEFSKLFKDWVFGDINHFSLIFSLSLTVLPQGYQATFAHGLQLTEKELVWGNFGDPSVKSYPWQHRPTLSTLKQKKIIQKYISVLALYKLSHHVFLSSVACHCWYFWWICAAVTNWKQFSDVLFVKSSCSIKLFFLNIYFYFFKFFLFFNLFDFCVQPNLSQSPPHFTVELCSHHNFCLEFRSSRWTACWSDCRQSDGTMRLRWCNTIEWK